VKFKVCKSVHLSTTQINHQPDATVFQFIILTFIYSSTCFGGFPAHHQELNDCSGSLSFYLRIVETVVLCSLSGRPAGWPARPRTQHDEKQATKILQYCIRPYNCHEYFEYQVQKSNSGDCKLAFPFHNSLRRSLSQNPMTKHMETKHITVQQYIFTDVTMHVPPKVVRLYFDVVVGLVWSHDPESYAGGSLCYR
jgi:hypothetical protein